MGELSENTQGANFELKKEEDYSIHIFFLKINILLIFKFMYEFITFTVFYNFVMSINSS